MTDPWLTFHPVIHFPISIGLLSALTAFMVWLEWKRPVSFQGLRVLAVIIMSIALGGFIFRPEYKTEKYNTVVLLTPEYSSGIVDSLQKLYPGMRVLHAPGVRHYKDSSPLNSWHALSDITAEIDFAIGQGLSSAALELIPPGSFQFIPSSYPAGITQLAVIDPVFPSRRNIIEGVIHTTDARTMLYLEGPGGKEDSLRIDKTGRENFHLTFTAKEPGNFLYTLRSDKGLQEVLPVHVQDHPIFNVLFIQNYPTFETRHLKNFLAKRHRLLFRYRLSRNTFRYEYINREQQPIDKLSSGLLSPFDLLVIDSDAWQSLSKDEVRGLQQAIRAGLGMILLFNEDPANIKGLDNFLPVTFKKNSSDTAHFAIESRRVILPAWPVTPVSENPMLFTFKNKNRILSGYCATGLGKMGFQLLQDTYGLSLQGDSIAYNTLWSGLLEQTSRTAKNKFTLRFLTPWPWFTDEPIVVEIISSGPEPELWEENNRIPLIEDPLIDNVWRGKIWSDKAGWHSLFLKNDSTQLPYYVSEKNTWSSLVSANAIRETSLHSASLMDRKKIHAFYEPVPLWIFYVLFIISAGALWLIPKF